MPWTRLCDELVNLYSDRPKLFIQVLEQFLALHGMKADGSVYDQIATTMHERSEIALAVAAWAQAADCYCGSHHQQECASCYANIGVCYIQTEDFEQSNVYTRAALDVAGAGADERLLLTCYSNLGNNYRRLGKYAEAIQCLKIAVELSRSVGALHQAVTWACLGLAYDGDGYYADAIGSFDVAAQLMEDAGNPAGQAAACSAIGRIYHSFGDEIQSNLYLQKAKELHAEAERLGIKYSSVQYI